MTDNLQLLKCNVGELWFVAHSSIAKCVRLREFHDPGVEYMMRRYKDYLSPFFDVGANVGLFSILAHTLSNGGGRVVAFEPDGENLLGLERNLKRAEASTVQVERCAVSDKVGAVKLGKIDCGLARHSKVGVIEIPCWSIDAFVAATGVSPRFIKADVEGAELQVADGASGVLDKCETVFEMEFSYRDLHGQLSSLLAIFDPKRWDIECHLRDAEAAKLPEVRTKLDTAHRVKHVPTNQVFWPVSAVDAAQVAVLLDLLRTSTNEDPSRKWELLFTPKAMTRKHDVGVLGEFEIRDRL